MWAKVRKCSLLRKSFIYALSEFRFCVAEKAGAPAAKLQTICGAVNSVFYLDHDEMVPT